MKWLRQLLSPKRDYGTLTIQIYISRELLEDADDALAIRIAEYAYEVALTEARQRIVPHADKKA